MTGNKARGGRVLRNAVVITGMAILLLAGGASAATLTVDDSGGAMFTRIQDALDASNPGDTIFVYNGIYIQNVVINKQIMLIGQNNTGSKPVIDANGGESAIFINASGVTVEGFDVRNSSYPGIRVHSNNDIIRNNNVSNNRDGIKLKNSDNNILTNNNISSNYGAGISLEEDSNSALIKNNVMISNIIGILLLNSSRNEIIGNNASNPEGFENNGIFMSNSSDNKISNNTYSSNTGAGIAMDISNNNTISNNILISNEAGLSINFSSNNTITGNNASFNSINGIALHNYSNNNTLDRNIASYNGCGIELRDSNYNTIFNNTANLNNKWEGFFIGSSSNNIISNNTVNNNNWSGIQLKAGSNYNIILNNTVNSNKEEGIFLNYSRNNSLINNYVNSNYYNGIVLSSSGNSTLIGNTMINNRYNFGLRENQYDSDFDNTIYTSNLVDGKPIYYIKNAADTVYDISTNAGAFDCIWCNNVTVKNLTLLKNGDGVFFWKTNNSKIENVSASLNNIGIYIRSSSNNTITKNTANSNIYVGIKFLDSSNSTIYNNHFNNTDNFVIENSANAWSITKISGTNIVGGPYLGGNFWANPSGTGYSQTCADDDSDGICDSPYTLAADNIDYLPLAYKPETRGDVNRNGVRDTGDATLLLSYIAELPIPEEYMPILPIGDMNCNGMIDTGDGTLVLRDVVSLTIDRCWE